MRTHACFASLLLAIVSVPPGVAAERLTYADLASRLTDLERLAASRSRGNVVSNGPATTAQAV